MAPTATAVASLQLGVWNNTAALDCGHRPPLRPRASRLVRHHGGHDDLAGEHWRNLRVAVARRRAGLGWCADSARQLPDRRLADSCGATLVVEFAGTGTTRVVCLLECGHLADRDGDC